MIPNGDLHRPGKQNITRMHRGTNDKLEGTAYHFRCGHPDLLKTRFKKKKKKLFTLDNARTNSN